MSLKSMFPASRLASSALIMALAVVPVGQAAADSGLVGGIVGGIIGGAIVNEANKNRRTTTRTYRSTSTGVSSAQREANRETQVALNYFGFPVGTPDGSLGPRSRSAVTTYQVTLGFPGTGQLNDFERDLLVTSYYRAQAGGPQVAQTIATNPRGVQGLLIAWKDERLGIQPAAPAAPAPAAGTLAAAPAAPAPSVPTFAAADPAAGSLPSFLAQGATQVSLASHCNKVSLVTNSNGGFVTQVTMTDPGFALAEQFCLARTYAMAQGEELVSKVQGVAPQQIASQCAGLGPVLKDNVSAVSLKPRDAVLQGVSSFVLGSGMAPAQLAGTAKICLGIGYTTDNMDVAMGSALLLVALGEAAYGELIAHHLAQGIGATKRPDLALAWYDGALGAPGELEVTSVFAPGMVDRVGLVRMAAYATAGQPLPGGNVPVAPGGATSVQTGLPSFNIPFVTTNP